jgi:hypothetical protein
MVADPDPAFQLKGRSGSGFCPSSKQCKSVTTGLHVASTRVILGMVMQELYLLFHL